MASVILLDTHVMVWLYGYPDRLPPAVRQRLDTEPLGISPFVYLELSYLHEIGRIAVPAREIFDELGSRLEMTHMNPSSASVCEAAVGLHWTRDPFDRLLAAHATADGMALVTKDKTIRQHLPLAWWGE